MSNNDVTEQDFTNELICQLAGFVEPLQIDTKVNLLYSLSVDDHGNLQDALDEDGRAKRGGGTGFEQDILVYETAQPPAYTAIIPRVIAEVKYKRMSTHSVLAYAEKARRIRTVYPYVRYGLVIGDRSNIPPRVIRLGQGFDFIIVLSYPLLPTEIERLGALFKQEIETSRQLAAIRPWQSKIRWLYRPLILD